MVNLVNKQPPLPIVIQNYLYIILFKKKEKKNGPMVKDHQLFNAFYQEKYSKSIIAGCFSPKMMSHPFSPLMMCNQILHFLNNHNSNENKHPFYL